MTVTVRPYAYSSLLLVIIGVIIIATMIVSVVTAVDAVIVVHRGLDRRNLFIIAVVVIKFLDILSDLHLISI